MPVAPDLMTSPAPTLPPRTPAAPRHDGMRRLQIGVAGVVIILLLVAMAGLASDRARENAGVMPASVHDAANSNNGNNSTPLEELGVQPVSKDGNSAAAVSAPSMAPSVNQIVANSGRGGGVPDLEPDPELERARQYKP